MQDHPTTAPLDPLWAFALPILAGVGVAMALMGVAAFANLHDEGEFWRAQSAELAAHPAVIAISEPDQQPAGAVVAAWDDDDHHYRVQAAPDGTFSISDPSEPTSVTGRASAVPAACADAPDVETYKSQDFNYAGHPYRVLFTSEGNAVICQKG